MTRILLLWEVRFRERSIIISNNNIKKTIGKIIGVLSALLIWQGLAMAVNKEMLLASPIQVVKRLATLIFEEDFLMTVLYSFFRIGSGFVLALVVGTILAVLAGRFSFLEYILWPYMVMFKSVPVASFIIICLLWLTAGQLPVFISFLITFPMIYGNVLAGIKNRDKNLQEMAELYGVPWFRRLIYIYIPELKPFLISAVTIGIGMSWKAGVTAEVIGIVKGSMGEKLYDAKVYFMNADLLSWTVVIIILSIATEKIVVALIKRLFALEEKL